MVIRDYYLPDECWECIFMFLNDDRDRRYLNSLSLVSKRFLLITNRVRFSLKFQYPTIGFLSRYFRRFPNLTSLDLSSHFKSDTLNNLLRNISSFPLNLTSLNLSNQTFPSDGLRYFSQNITTLTSLICSNMLSISSTDLFLIADCFPLLKKLDLSKPKKLNPNSNSTNLTVVNRNSYFLDGVEALSSKLSELRRINLSRHYYMNDRSLFHLFKNCKFLKEAIIFYCYHITINGIANAICERPTLTSLSMLRSFKRGNHVIVRSITPHFINSLVSLKGLTSLDLSSLNISDELLSSIATEGLPLTKLVLHHCTGYSYDGIFRLLFKCRRLRHLDLQYTRFQDNQHLTDEHLVQLSSFLGHLISINLNHCRKLTESALFALARNCPLLSEIKMEYTHIGKESAENSNHSMDSVVCPQLKSLHLGNNFWLRDENIIMFASIFPNLQLFEWDSSNDIISKGIFFHVIKRCCKIRHLNLAFNDEANLLNLLRMNFEVPKLEVLDLSFTQVNYGTLYVISKNCRGLLRLLLQYCCGVTEIGVKIVLENCTQLREINLRGCDEVSSNIISSMISSRPSLRKIIAPPDFDLKDKEKKHFFLSQGCLVC